MHKVISTEIIYDGPKVKVGQDKIELSNGKIDYWDVIVSVDAYVGIPVTKDLKVIMCKEWRQGPRDMMLQFTTAKPKDGETGKGSLIREMNEELGLTNVSEDDLNFLAKCSAGTRVTGTYNFFTVEKFTKSEQQNLDENEVLEIVEIPIKDLYKTLMRKPETVAAQTMLAAKLLEEKYL